MNNADMPAMPVYEIHETCGFDGNSGPDLMQTISNGLTKREHFAGLAMQALISNGNAHSEYTASITALSAIELADALLEQLEESK